MRLSHPPIRRRAAPSLPPTWVLLWLLALAAFGCLLYDSVRVRVDEDVWREGEPSDARADAAGSRPDATGEEWVQETPAPFPTLVHRQSVPNAGSGDLHQAARSQHFPQPHQQPVVVAAVTSARETRRKPWASAASRARESAVRIHAEHSLQQARKHNGTNRAEPVLSSRARTQPQPQPQVKVQPAREDTAAEQQEVRFHQPMESWSLPAPIDPQIISAAKAKEMPNPAILLICFDRPDYLTRTIASLAGLAGLQHFSVYVSQDGRVSRLVDDIAQAAVSSGGAFAPPHTRGAWHLHHPRESPVFGPKQQGHAWLSQHYKWALDEVFHHRGHSHVVIVEDDMEFSADFLRLFQATSWLLEVDPTLWCISSWNDYGYSSLIWDRFRLMRTSFFPGLGWMTTRKVWETLRGRFPDASWDNWMRSGNMKGLECVVPEVNRNFNFGKKGANLNPSQYTKLLGNMHHYTGPADHGMFEELDYLLPFNFASAALSELHEATRIDWRKMSLASLRENGVYSAFYRANNFQAMSKTLRLGHDSVRLNYQGLTRLPVSGSATLLLVNEIPNQLNSVIPPDMRAAPPEGMKAVVGSLGEPCTDVCRRSRRVCQDKYFDFLNSPEVMHSYFGCERGFGLETGKDLPAYVVAPEEEHYQACVFNFGSSLCSGKHKATARLCPCLPTG